MSPEEWLGIARWLADNGVRLTADTVLRWGKALARFDTQKVFQACVALEGRGAEVNPKAIVSEIRSRPSKYAPILAKRHLELFPNGCPAPHCDLCLDAHRPVV